MAWLANNDPDYGQMGEDAYGDLYGISTRKKANERRRRERSLTPDLIDHERSDYYHCPACHRRATIAAHTVD
jgi:hypothetical protein